ncbi:hypothetical protein HOK51_04695 [Candidatus Woesearchaeota archaeon]|jgi:hypothetical protein|nr:hypothetical protein [Candidatus Woesearchaeota archaeon]MBT6519123.1 hypothetical protein [Candidatus Woesearchaeota archaeon]
MAKKQPRTHDENIELIITVGALFIAASCMIWLGFLLWKLENNVSQYAVASLTSITTLIMGYLFGKHKNGTK